MTVYRAKAADNGSVLRATLSGLDLSTATAVVVVLRPNGTPEGTDELELDSVEVVDPATSEVDLTIRSTDGVARADYYMLWRAFFPGGISLTVPSEGSDYLLMTA